MVKVEYRGTSREITAGETFVVESCGAGVLVLRPAGVLGVAEVSAPAAPASAPQPAEGGPDV